MACGGVSESTRYETGTGFTPVTVWKSSWRGQTPHEEPTERCPGAQSSCRSSTWGSAGRVRETGRPCLSSRCRGGAEAWLWDVCGECGTGRARGRCTRELLGDEQEDAAGNKLSQRVLS